MAETSPFGKSLSRAKYIGAQGCEPSGMVGIMG